MILEKPKKLVEVSKVKWPETITISNKEGYEKAVHVLKEIKTAIKEIESERKKSTKPIDEAKKTIMGWFKPIVDGLKDQEKKIKSEMMRYEDQKEKERIEEEDRLAKNMEKFERIHEEVEELESKGEIDKAIKKSFETKELDMTTNKELNHKNKSVSYVSTWDYEITDMNKIPREYLVPDLKRIGAEVRKMKSEFNVEGIKVVETKAPRVRL